MTDQPTAPDVPPRPKVTTEELRAMKRDGVRIAVLTAYDHLMAGLLDAAGLDVLLVGDSLANVVQGEETTVPVTMEMMANHEIAKG